MASEALAGDASDIFLSGRSGIGKTELLRHVYNHLFWKHNYVIPFFYTVDTSHISARDFSKDYISEFIIQSLAYLKKDHSLIDAAVYYSPEDLMQLARDRGAGWAGEIMESYMRIDATGDPAGLLSYAVSVPYRCYLDTGVPVLVILDDFHKVKELYGLVPGDSGNLWLQFERVVGSRYTPHIFSGSRPVLDRMFFEESSLGECLELINLHGLGRNESAGFLKILFELYGLNAGEEPAGLIDTFGGNPFYIKSFAQAARQAGRELSGDDLWDVYFDEITRGKLYRYWTTILKSNIPYDLRAPALNLLYHLCTGSAGIDIVKLPESLSIEPDKIERIINVLYYSGAVETGFSRMGLADDRILSDIIRALYHREIPGEPVDRIRAVIIGDRTEVLKKDRVPSFDIAIPSDPGSELVAVKSLHQIALHFNMPLDAAGHVQIALIELFTDVFARNGGVSGGYRLEFKLEDDIFSIEIMTPSENLAVTDDDRRYLREYIDELRVERTRKGTRVTLLKNLSRKFAPAL
ncbi:MAG: hypothetical protein GXP46_00350 [Deferribacteres bacterium]|nr:hypothetical protein [Deferribacteres bacterium]